MLSVGGFASELAQPDPSTVMPLSWQAQPAQFFFFFHILISVFFSKISLSYYVFKNIILRRGSIGFNRLSKGPWHVKVGDAPCTERFGDHFFLSVEPFRHLLIHTISIC